MDTIIVGGLIRALQGLAASAPTLLIGLCIAALLKYYIGPAGTRRLFGGESMRSLPQSWLIGMLLPVCSIGVLPILREMKRAGIRPGAITAFALSAPLFNPLSLLYGLTLSRPFVILGFAFASLAVVTVLGIFWDRLVTSSTATARAVDVESELIGLRRITTCFVFTIREICGPTGVLTLIALSGLLLLGMLLPHGALQSSVEQLDPLAPARMALVAIPVYATPMLAMSQLGMMFAHGNSPGAAFCLLILGTGLNFATIVWIAQNYGRKATLFWLWALLAIVVACGYAVERPLIPPGVEPAGHTHAFDIYTNPLHVGPSVTFGKVSQELEKTIGITEKLGLGAIGLAFIIGLGLRTFGARSVEQFLKRPIVVRSGGLDRQVSPQIVGLTVIAGLIAFSIVGCYAYYPSPEENLEEMRIARTEALAAATSDEFEVALHWIPILDEWSRRLEVGTVIRRFELRPYQQAQTQLLRKKLELLEHELEHEFMEQQLANRSAHTTEVEYATEEPIDDKEEHIDEEHEKEIRLLISQIMATSQRISRAFQ